MRLAALAASGARTLAIVEEITAIVFLTLAVTTLAGNLALQLLIHGGEATTRGARGTRRSARR
jgi:NhaP-type Na+/H+ or K+/H+ antiporter